MKFNLLGTSVASILFQRGKAFKGVFTFQGALGVLSPLLLKLNWNKKDQKGSISWSRLGLTHEIWSFLKAEFP
jgi:hypothetical protein